jgi:multiple sugar transport system ATP-binding protein
MNLFDGVLESKNDGLHLRTGFGDFALPPRLADGLVRNPATAGATQVACGIRAEDVAIGSAVGAQAGVPEGVIDLVEPLGSDVFVSVAMGSDMLLARASPDLPLQEMQKTPVTLNLARLHLFDAESGYNLLA